MTNTKVDTLNITFENRFNNALKEIRRKGVKARRNVMGCCRGCVIGDGYNENTPFIEHYGGQGNKFMLDGNHAYYVSGNDYKPIDAIYFSHDNLVTDGEINEFGRIVLDTFDYYGIVIDWDKSDGMSIIVKPLVSIPHRTPHEEALLVNTLMDRYNLTAEQLLEHNYAYTTITPMLYELKYTDEYLDGIAKRIREAVDEAEERMRNANEANAKRQEQLRINEEHQLRLSEIYPPEDTLYPPKRVERTVMFIEATRPLMEFSGDELAEMVEYEAVMFMNSYSDSKRMVDDLLFHEIEALPEWASVSYWDAEQKLRNNHLIRHTNRTYFVWAIPQLDGYDHEATKGGKW